MALFLHFFQWNKLRPLIARESRQRLGRELLIAGDLDLHLAWNPRLTMDNVSFENAPWAGDAPLFKAQHLEVSIAILPLFKRRLELPFLRLTGAELNLAHRADGVYNWTMPTLDKTLAERAEKAKNKPQKPVKNPSVRDWFPLLEELDVHDFRFHYADQATGLATTVKFAEALSQQRSLDQGLHILLDGDLMAHLPAGGELPPSIFRIEASGGSLLKLKVDHGWPLKLAASLGEINLDADGIVGEPREMRGLDMHVAGSARGLGPVLQALGMHVGVIAPIKLKGHLIGGGKDWHGSDVDLSLGDSRVLGSFAVRDDERLAMSGDLRSPFIDLDDIRALFPAKPAAAPAAAPTPPPGKKDDKPEPLFSAEPFNIASLRGFDLDLHLAIKQMIAAAKANDLFDDGELEAHLHGGDLRIPKLALTDHLGHFLASGHFDARGSELLSSLTLDAAHIDVGSLIQKLTGKIEASQEAKIASGKRSRQRVAKSIRKEAQAVGRDTYGELGGRTQLATFGNSPKAMVDHLNGPIGIALQNGHISDVLTYLAELDLGKAIGSYFKGDKGSTVDCMIVSFNIKNGDGKSDTLLLVNKETNLLGRGDVNLAAETLDLRFDLQPKKFSIDSLRAPLMVKGSLRSPSVHFDVKPILARVGAAVALGAVITPPAAVLAFIDTGLGKKNLCSQHLDELAKLQPLKQGAGGKGAPEVAH